MVDIYPRPNVDSYTESLVFRTNDFESLNGRLDTVQMLVDYKYRVKYTAILFLTERHKAFLNLFRKGLTEVMLHPLWGQSSFIAQTLTSTTTVPCDTTKSRFIVGDKVFITHGYDTFNIVTIVSVSSSSLIVDTAVDIIAGHLVIPSITGIVSGEISTNYTGERHATCEITVEEWK